MSPAQSAAPSGEQGWRARLFDGKIVTVRALLPSDEQQLVDLYASLDDHECYLRFFTMHPAHLQQWARSLTTPAPGQFALGAFEAGRLLGAANYVIGPDPARAEIAVTVAHREHLRGVGTALLQRIGLMAKENGVLYLVADVLTANHPMMRLLSDAGWPVHREQDGFVVHVVVDLRDC